MPFDPAAHLGETVTFRGTAHTARAGAVVLLPGGSPVYISGLVEWAESVAGQEVEVTGQLRRRTARRPEVEGTGEHVHGLGETIALDEATWALLP